MIQLVLKDWSLKGIVFWGLASGRDRPTRISFCAFDQTKESVSLYYGLLHKEQITRGFTRKAITKATKETAKIII